jgi:hypothetical protein
MHRNKNGQNRTDRAEKKGFEMKRKISIYIFVLTLVLQVFGQSVLLSSRANAAPDYTSTYLPELKSFKTTVATVIRTEQAFGKDFKFESKEFIFDFSVKVHRNTLSGISIIMQGPSKPTTSLSTPCETFEGTIFSGALRYGSDYNSASNWPQLSGIQSRVQQGDFYLETYQLKGDIDWTFAEDREEGMGFCEGTYFLSQIDLWDQAKRSVSIYTPSSTVSKLLCVSTPSNCDNGISGSDFWKKNKLLSSACTKIREYDYQDFTYYTNCYSGDWRSMDFSISKSNTPSATKLEVFDYKALYESVLQEKNSLQSQLKTATTDRDANAAQVSSFKSQVASLTSDKTSLQSQVASLTSDKTSLQSQVASLTSDKTSLQSQVVSLSSARAELSALQKRFQTICKAKPKPKGC